MRLQATLLFRHALRKWKHRQENSANHDTNNHKLKQFLMAHVFIHGKFPQSAENNRFAFLDFMTKLYHNFKRLFQIHTIKFMIMSHFLLPSWFWLFAPFFEEFPNRSILQRWPQTAASKNQNCATASFAFWGRPPWFAPVLKKVSSCCALVCEKQLQIGALHLECAAADRITRF